MTSITSQLWDKSETHLNQKTIRKLQDIRRANAAIQACVEILYQNDVNRAFLPVNRASLLG